MQTAVRAASSAASARSRSLKGSLPFVRENLTSPTTVSRATSGTARVEWTSPVEPSTFWARAVRSAVAQGEPYS